MLSTKAIFEYILKKVKIAHLFTSGCQNRFKLMKTHPKMQKQCQIKPKINFTTYGDLRKRIFTKSKLFDGCWKNQVCSALWVVELS